MSLEIDFNSVDMHDVETLAMLMDDFVDPHYSKILDIIIANNQFEEFIAHYLEINGSPFVKRKILSTTVVFNKEFDVEEGWPYLGNKEIDEDDFLPVGCTITNGDRTSPYPNIQVKIVKEYSYIEESSSEMDVDDSDEERVSRSPIIPTPSTSKVVLDKDFGAIVERLEKDFPQKARKIKRVTRWAPVLLKKPVKVGERNSASGEGDAPMSFEEEFESSTAPSSFERAPDAIPSTSRALEIFNMEEDPNNMKRKISDSIGEEDDHLLLNAKKMKGNEKRIYYEASYKSSHFYIIEDDYRTKHFEGFSYTSHFRTGRFHILCRDFNYSVAASNVNEIGVMMAKGAYIIK